MAHLYQLLGNFDVRLTALGLAVVACGAAAVRPLIPVQTQPPQVPDHAVLALPRAARKVGVLYSQHKLAARLLGYEVAVQRGAGAAHVQRPRWRRREAQPLLVARDEFQPELLEDVGT